MRPILTRPSPPDTLRAACWILPLLFVPAAVAQWTQPTAAELQMTSEPKAPGAPAIILSYDRTDDGDSAQVDVHVRIKVLTSDGASAGNIAIPNPVLDSYDFKAFNARTIHSDGSILPFVRGPQNPAIGTTQDGDRIGVVSMPSVEPGSIIEYSFRFWNDKTRYNGNDSAFAPTWQVQQAYFIRSAHFSLKTPYAMEPETTRWVATLPPGATINRDKVRVTLDLADIPAAAAEDFMPPPDSVLYRVRFFYRNPKLHNYWGEIGDKVSDVWGRYDKPGKGLISVINSLTLPSDTSDAKLRKLYEAVQSLENTDFTRRRSDAEDKAANLEPIKNSEDIWDRKRGSSSELTHLFIALARAAGFKAYPMEVTSRDHGVFDQNILSWSQLDSMLAVVALADKEVFLDPGTPFCAYGDLAATHSHVVGVTIEEKLVKIGSTPTLPPAASQTERRADLTLSAAGEVTGTVKISWNRNAALALRYLALREDSHAVETRLERDLQSEMPPEVEVHVIAVTGLGDRNAPLTAQFSVSGKLGVLTGKRLILPAQILLSNDTPLLSSENRSLPISFPQPFISRDQTVFHLPAQLSLEALPQSANLSIGNRTAYASGAAVSAKDPHTLVSARTFVLKDVDYKLEDYPALHKYFGQVATFDQNRISLQISPAIAVPAGDR